MEQKDEDSDKEAVISLLALPQETLPTTDNDYGRGVSDDDNSANSLQVRRGPATPTRIVEASPSIRHRRSQSVALPASSSWNDTQEEYVAPRALWRKQSTPERRSDGDQPTGGNEIRNTQFYGFYDDIMSDYRGRTYRQI